MAFIVSRSRRKKQKYPRANHRRYKPYKTAKIRKKIYKVHGWKLKFPDLFEEIDKYPYIIRKE